MVVVFLHHIFLMKQSTVTIVTKHMDGLKNSHRPIILRSKVYHLISEHQYYSKLKTIYINFEKL
jgi:hypothetical protein